MNVAVMGAGAISRRGHLPALLNMPTVEQIGVFDLNSSLLESVGREFPGIRLYKSIDEILHDPMYEIVHICTPTNTHSELAIAAMRSGKHVLVEKPLTTNTIESLEMFRASVDTGQKIGIVKNWRYFPSVIDARRRVEEGYLGKLVSVNGLSLTRFPNSWTRGTWLYNEGAVLFDFTPHLVDMVLWFNDSIVKSVYAIGGDFTRGQMKFNNYAQILLEFVNGSIACLDTSWLTGTLVFELQIHGTSGHIKLDVKNDLAHEFHGTVTPVDDLRHFWQQMRSMVRGLRSGTFFGGPMMFYEKLILDYQNRISNRQDPPVSLRQGIMITLVLEAAQESLLTRSPVEISTLMRKSGFAENEIGTILQPPTPAFYASRLYDTSSSN